MANNITFEKDVVFVVVRFQEEKTDKNLATVELVPTTWLTKKNSSWFSAYPPEKYYHKVADYRAQKKHPDKSWKSFAVDIIKTAGILLKNKY